VQLLLPDVKSIVANLLDRFDPVMILLFGSYATANNRPDSDIDLCLIVEVDTPEARGKLEYDIEYFLYDEDDMLPIDVIVYSKQEWLDNIADPTSFATRILKDGVILYKRL
jgi:predicted nucleotidyltransferase